ncbi:MAG TPA: site-2 protease family protein [Stellaceae bacterium]|nr:site-2 protease family protein [Stellaceae bacterium]
MTPEEFRGLIQAISILALPAIFAITFHEAAHGLVAHWLGDDTAWSMGRVTFNPLKHIDPVGTILIPLLLFFSTGFLFGYAKPVPVNFGRLRHPRRDMIFVALAGPATNILLAVVSAALQWFLPFIPNVGHSWAAKTLSRSIDFNLILAVFNLIPLPPLDGGRVAVAALPDALAFPLARLERSGLFILVGVLILLPMVGQTLHLNLDFFRYIILIPAAYLRHLISWLVGWS